jgi:hypothetical protein
MRSVVFATPGREAGMYSDGDATTQVEIDSA